MPSESLIVLRATKRALPAGLSESLREVIAEFVTFERTHARLAWSTTLVGLAIGLALQALG